MYRVSLPVRTLDQKTLMLISRSPRAITRVVVLEFLTPGNPIYKSQTNFLIGFGPNGTNNSSSFVRIEAI